MSNDEQNRWPEYLYLIPPDDIFAVGVITLNYSRLENTFLELFWRVTGKAADFHRANNDRRTKLVLELLDKSGIPEPLMQPIRDFLDAFKKCADHRNAVAHSFTPGAHKSKSTGQRGILLFKFTRKGEPLVCAANTVQLRALADDVFNWSTYAAHINSRLRVYDETRRTGGEIALPALPDKPPAPTELNWGAPPEGSGYLFGPAQ